MRELTFWDSLPRPIIGLAPMDGVTDQPCRYIQKKYGDPMIVYTEFTNVEGICKGALSLLRAFIYDESQRPVIAQIYGNTPICFRQTAVLLCELGFDGIDINMGCPAKKIAHRGAGAGLIRTPDVAQEIVRATKAGVDDWLNGMTTRDCPDIKAKISNEVESRRQALPAEYQTRRFVPVSVKTRIGYDAPVTKPWISNLLEVEPFAIGVHGRTLEQGYSGSADWDEIAIAAEVTQDTETLLLGNGDIESLADAETRVGDYHVDGVLIGRAAFGNPFVFQDPTRPELIAVNGFRQPANMYQMIDIAIEHCQLFEDTFRDAKKYRFSPMRKHLSWYIKGMPSARGLRRHLLQTSSPAEVSALLDEYYAYRSRWDG